MSVIRQPAVLGRSTRRRVVGITAALAAAAVETLSVGLWFLLVVDARSTSTALAGLGLLLAGSLLRTGIVGMAVSGLDDDIEPRRLGAPLVQTAGWILWLYLAEVIGGGVGIAVATVVLGISRFAGLMLERRAYHLYSYGYATRRVLPLVLTATLPAVGAATLLASAWFTDWAVVFPPVSVELTTVVLRIDAVQIGVVVFGLFVFLAHQRRFQRVLDP